MKIEAVKFVAPKTRVGNDQVLDLIRETSKNTFDGDLDTALRAVGFMLDSIGLKERYWMGEQRPLDLMLEAAEKAIVASGLDRNEIDVLIFCGIARGGIIGDADETIGDGAEFISEWISLIRSITGCGS